MQSSSSTTSSPRPLPIVQFWTIRLLLINATVFVAMCIQDGSWLLPSDEILIQYGAKYSYGLIRGEYYRLITPVFVHVGLIHFAINSFALFVIGRNVETYIGSKLFLVIYLVSGLTGSVASAVVTMGNSAGASGAIFGVVGAGFVLERIAARKVYLATGQRLRRGPFTGLVIANVIIGLILMSGPVRVDNAAHLGGLAAGCLIMLAMHWKKTLPSKRARPVVIFLLIAVWNISGAVLATSEVFYREKVYWMLDQNFSSQTKYEILTEAIRTLPQDKDFYFRRGSLLVFDKQFASGLQDFEKVGRDPAFKDAFRDLIKEMKLKNLESQALVLERMFL